MSNLSVLSTLTSIALLHETMLASRKYRSDIEVSKLSLVVAAFPSPVRYGLEPFGVGDTFCSAGLVLFKHVKSATDCLVHFFSQLLYARLSFPVSTAGGMQPDLL